MKRAILFALLVAFVGVVVADPGSPNGVPFQSTLDWKVKGALGINHTTSAGSGVGTSSYVNGGLSMNRPGFTSVSAWSRNDTGVWSSTDVIDWGCGYCDDISLDTASGGYSYSRGGATGFIGPRLDPVTAEFGAAGEGVALTEYTRSFTLDLSGWARYDELGLDDLLDD